MNNQEPLVSIIIPTYNRSRDLDLCLDSIFASTYSNYEVIVVDNASEEDIHAIIVEKQRVRSDISIQYIHLEHNMMAAGGRNAGIQAANGDYLLFIDSDNIIDKRMITLLVDGMEQNKRIGMIGPVMLYYRQPEMVWFAGNDINMVTSKTTYWNHNQDVCKLRNDKIFATHHIPNLMMVRRTVQQEVGLFDEQYYIMYEEADFAMRIRKKGYEIMVCRDAITYHNCFLPQEVTDNEMRKLGCDNPVRTYHFSKNRGIFIRKYAPWYGRVSYKLIFRFVFAVYYCGIAIKNKRFDIAKAWWKGVFYKDKEGR